MTGWRSWALGLSVLLGVCGIGLLAAGGGPILLIFAALALITALQDMGARVRAYDPAGMEQAKAVLQDVTYFEDLYACAEQADALVLVTEWEQFRALDLERLKSTMASPVVVDLRNIYRPDEMAELGFIYDSVGRATPAPATAERQSASLRVVGKPAAE